MEPSEEKLVESIRQHMRNSRGLDIDGYSRMFILRCVRRRIGRVESKDLAEYVRNLRSSDEETSQLVSALSINVTDFFRDPVAFQALSEKVIRPVVLSKKGTGGIVRVWSAGCATGQEAYTVAICLEEELGRVGGDENILGTVTAGDLSLSALTFARKGVYRKEQVANIPPLFLNAYFVKRNGSYEVGDVIKRRVRFVKENLLDEPKSRFFDVAVCRNVLIYFSRPMHDQVAMNFHKALRPGGYLMLGKTESLVGQPRPYFELVDAENRIFRKLG